MSSTTETLHVACATRSDYLPHAAAMIHSLLSAGGSAGVHVHFLHGPDLTAEFREPLAGMVDRLGGEISFLLIPDERVAGLRTVAGMLPASHWYRVFLPELLPGLDRVLYLDADLIVLEPLDPLWGTEIGDHYLAAVTNVFQADHRDRPATLGLEPGRYFNSGVLLMNLERLRAEDAIPSVLEYAAAHRERIAWPEQDALNVVLGDRRLPLHPRWNCMNSFFVFPWAEDVFGADALGEATREPAIRHFEGPSVNKPWHFLCEREMRELYARHRSQTPWPAFTPEGRTVRNVLRRYARGRRSRVTSA